MRNRNDTVAKHQRKVWKQTHKAKTKTGKKKGNDVRYTYTSIRTSNHDCVNVYEMAENDTIDEWIVN